MSGLTLLRGNCLDVLPTLAAESINCLVTSPPYWGLRDYGTDPLDWPAIDYSPLPGLPPCVAVPAMSCSLGLEPTLDAFIGHMVLIFRQVHRVMRADGVSWVNMGDSYATGTPRERKPTETGKHGYWENPAINKRIDGRECGLKPKDLVGQPWRLAFALQADGWWIRQDVIWSKLNPMPESTRDRCTKAHEFIFMLTKSERYWSDFDAIKEAASQNTHQRAASTGVGFGHGYDADPKPRVKAVPFGWATGPGPHTAVAHQTAAMHRKVAKPGSGTKNNGSFDAAMAVMPERRNMRDVWPLATEPYSEAHFATFPTEIPRRCILAGCPPGGTVLDPFNGSGTTGQVALELGRSYVGIELNPAYLALTQRRLAGVTPGFVFEAEAFAA